MNSPKRPLWALYFGELISTTGDSMAALAIPWFVLQTTGSAVQTGITAFFSVTPIVIGQFFGGAVVDRVGYKRMSIIADLASGVTVLLIPLLYYTTGISFEGLLALVFLGGLLDTPGRAAREAMIPDLTAKAGMTLERSNGLRDAAFRATRMIGAPLAGVLLAIIEAHGVLLVNGLTFFVSALCIGLLVPDNSVTQPKSSENSYLQDLWEGLAFVKRDDLLLTFSLVVMCTNLLDVAMSSVILPVYAKTVYGEEQGAVSLGLIFGVFSGAALVGALIYSAYGTRFSRRWAFTIGFVLVSLRFFVFMLRPPLPILLALLAVNGLAVAPLNPVISTELFERTPANLRARVSGVLGAGAWIGMPLGGLMAGLMLGGIGLQNTLLLCGVLYCIITLSMVFLPAMRNWQAKEKAVEAEKELEIQAEGFA
jgi:MFS family permease